MNVNFELVRSNDYTTNYRIHISYEFRHFSTDHVEVIDSAMYRAFERLMLQVGVVNFRALKITYVAPSGRELTFTVVRDFDRADGLIRFVANTLQEISFGVNFTQGDDFKVSGTDGDVENENFSSGDIYMDVFVAGVFQNIDLGGYNIPDEIAEEEEERERQETVDNLKNDLTELFGDYDALLNANLDVEPVRQRIHEVRELLQSFGESDLPPTPLLRDEIRVNELLLEIEEQKNVVDRLKNELLTTSDRNYVISQINDAINVYDDLVDELLSFNFNLDRIPEALSPPPPYDDDDSSQQQSPPSSQNDAVQRLRELENEVQRLIPEEDNLRQLIIDVQRVRRIRSRVRDAILNEAGARLDTLRQHVMDLNREIRFLRRQL